MFVEITPRLFHLLHCTFTPTTPLVSFRLANVSHSFNPVLKEALKTLGLLQMITPETLYSVVNLLGMASMVTVVAYHVLAVNAKYMAAGGSN